LEDDPGRFLPPDAPELPNAVHIDFDGAPQIWLEKLRSLPAGSTVLLSGTVALARDAAHARILSLLEQGEPAPAAVMSRPIFYAGPTEPKEGFVSGAIGPTSAKRMDSYMAPFLGKGLGLVTIGKGERGKDAVDAIRRFGGVYLAAIGGVAALNARRHVAASVVKDYADLGMEAVRHVRLVDLPAIVAIDAHGASIYCGQDYGRR
jgi:fumarate hydratase class I